MFQQRMRCVERTSALACWTESDSSDQCQRHAQHNQYTDNDKHCLPPIAVLTSSTCFCHGMPPDFLSLHRRRANYQASAAAGGLYHSAKTPAKRPLCSFIVDRFSPPGAQCNGCIQNWLSKPLDPVGDRPERQLVLTTSNSNPPVRNARRWQFPVSALRFACVRQRQIAVLLTAMVEL